MRIHNSKILATGRRGFTLIEMLVVIAIIGVLVSLLLPAVQASREAARRIQCQNHLKQLSLAFHMHHDSLQFFPTGGWDWQTPPTYAGGAPATGRAQQAGWGFQVLPYIEQAAVWNGNGAATDNDKALLAIGTPITIFFCPTRRQPQTVVYSYPGYLGGLNAKHALCDYSTSNLDGNGAVRQYDPRRIADITDGTSQTLLIGDKRLNRASLGKPQADDNEGYTCGWNEDTVRLTSQKPQPDFIGDPALFGGKMFGSSHPSGFNTALCDGSVRTVSYYIDLSTFKTLGDIADGQTVNVNGL
jgi:prepilin-type N-terminal cleavage/methylation domain-containing protein